MADMKDSQIFTHGIVVIFLLTGRHLIWAYMHHQSASKPYPLLSQEEKAIEMPANYSVMLMMALIPPLWFFIMDKKIENLKTI